LEKKKKGISPISGGTSGNWTYPALKKKKVAATKSGESGKLGDRQCSYTTQIWRLLPFFTLKLKLLLQTWH
jgi:hypothetical protein